MTVPPLPENAVPLVVGPDEFLLIVISEWDENGVESLAAELRRAGLRDHFLIILARDVKLAKLPLAARDDLRVAGVVDGERVEIDVPPGPVRDAIERDSTRGLSLPEQPPSPLGVQRGEVTEDEYAKQLADYYAREASR